MKFVGRSRYWFTPKIKGNRALSDSEKLQIEIIRPAAEEAGSLSSVKMTRGSGGEVAMENTFDTKKILRHHVGEIKNLVIVEKNDNGEETEKKIENGAALAEAKFYGAGTLVSLICTEVMRDVLTEEEKKS